MGRERFEQSREQESREESCRPTARIWLLPCGPRQCHRHCRWERFQNAKKPRSRSTCSGVSYSGLLARVAMVFFGLCVADLSISHSICEINSFPVSYNDFL